MLNYLHIIEVIKIIHGQMPINLKSLDINASTGVRNLQSAGYQFHCTLPVTSKVQHLFLTRATNIYNSLSISLTKSFKTQFNNYV